MKRETHNDGYVLLQAGIWLVFLTTPLFILFVMELPRWQLIAGIVLVIAFGLVYMCAYGLRIAATEPLNGAAFLAVLAVLTIALTAIIGPFAAVLLSYIAAVAGSLLSPRLGLGVSVLMMGAYGIYVSVVAAGNMQTLIYYGISVAIGFIVFIQVAAQRLSDERAMLSTELELSRQRESIYRDVHDLLGHSLTVISVKSSLAQKLIEADPLRAQRELADISELSRDGLDDVRRAVRAAHTPTLTAELDAARKALTAAGISVQITTDKPQDSPLFGWVLREAVTNVIRHSHATECRIAVSAHTLVVADNGIGLAPDTQVRTITQRVHAAGGHVTVTPNEQVSQNSQNRHNSSPGTRVEVRA